MMLIGVDYHPIFQQIAFFVEETGECGEQELNHSDGQAEKFYQDLKQRGISVRVGMGATGYARWFERLLAELGFELWIGDPAEIKAKRVKKQKTDRKDAQLLLRLMREKNFPQIWVPSSENRDLRQLLWHQHRLVQMRTRIMNQLLALAMNEGYRWKKKLFREQGQGDARLASNRTRILNHAESLGRKIFHETSHLPSEYYVIRDLTRERATDFVLACLDSEKSSLSHLQSAFREMQALGGPRVMACIEQLAANAGPLAKDAAIFLDEAGPVTPDKIAAKSARWRKTRNARDLRWLFYRHIEANTPQGSTIEEILTLLGKPSEGGEGFYSWESKDPQVHLYLETDKSGRFDWMKLYVD